LGTYTSIIINTIQFIFVIIGLIYIQKLVGKRSLFLFSITILSLLNIGLAIAMIYSQVLAAEMIMCIYMAVLWGILHFSNLVLPFRNHSCESVFDSKHRALACPCFVNADSSSDHWNNAQQQCVPCIFILWALWAIQPPPCFPIPQVIWRKNLQWDYQELQVIYIKPCFSIFLYVDKCHCFGLC
jgi:hypothetical protein